jgi:acetyltransferase-like isoleucine patch superfamily enzyme
MFGWIYLRKTEKAEVENLLALHSAIRKKVKAKWNRTLPFDELVFDRWEKAKYLGSGEGTSIYHNSYVYGDVSIGKSTWIGPFTVLDGSGGKLTIGDHCSVSTGVQIYTHNTVKWALSGGKSKYETAATSIGDNCYLGPYAIVTMGIHIGSNCLIGAHTLVNKPVPKNSIVFGVPGRVVGKVKVKGDSVEMKYD